MSSKAYVVIRVPASPARSFAAFTEEIAQWWQASPLFPITPRGDGTLAFEGGAGGRLFTTFADGEEFEIGRISVWEPGARLVFGWRMASFGRDLATEVEVRFEAVGAETRIAIEHRAWDTIPQDHAARHGFPEHITLQHVGRWWRGELERLGAWAAAG
jgi:hypothetical protein